MFSCDYLRIVLVSIPLTRVPNDAHIALIFLDCGMDKKRDDR